VKIRGGHRGDESLVEEPSPDHKDILCGNFEGWSQAIHHRKLLPSYSRLGNQLAKISGADSYG